MSRQHGVDVLARDMNEDGLGDLVVGASGAGEELGTVQILFGEEGGLRAGGATTIEPPEGIDGHFGLRLRTSDIDGEGHVDLVEGAPDPVPCLTYGGQAGRRRSRRAASRSPA